MNPDKKEKRKCSLDRRSLAVDDDFRPRIVSACSDDFLAGRKIRICPTVKKTCFLSLHIDAAVGHRVAEIIMPVGPVNSVSTHLSHFSVVEKHSVRNIRKIIVGSQLLGAAGHLGETQFGPNAESAGRGPAPFA